MRNLLVIPSLVIVIRAWEAMIDVFTSIDWENYLEDQLAIQQRLQDAFRPPTDLAVLSGLASGASIAVALIGFSAVTAATLAVVDGRRPAVGGGLPGRGCAGRGLDRAGPHPGSLLGGWSARP